MENMHSRFENAILDCIAKPVGEEAGRLGGTDELIDALFIKQDSLTVIEASGDVDSIVLGASLVHRLAKKGHEVLYVPLRGEEDAIASLIGLEAGVSRVDISASSEGRVKALEASDRLRKLKVGLWSTDLVTAEMLWEVLERACSEVEELFVVLDSVELLEPPHSDGVASTVRALRGFSGDGITIIAIASEMTRASRCWPFAAASSVVTLSADEGKCGIRATVAQSEQIDRRRRRVLPLDPQTFLPN